MKNLYVLAVAAVIGLAGSAAAEEAAKQFKSGPQEGDRIGAFRVEKLCGAENDNVKVGDNICYRCKNGSRPQVMVFTRSAGPKVAQLVKKLDKAVAQNEESELRVFVNFMGDDREDIVDTAKKFAAKSKAKHIPFVVPNEFANGPDNYGINAKAEVTVVLASDSKVKANYAVGSANELNVDAVVDNLSKILN